MTMECRRPTLSLAMIVKDEAQNLPRLFKSIEGCFDSVHITDTGSTDGTQEIVKAYGFNLHNFEWCDDFSAARNASFEPVKTDYVMWMDADDVLENKEAFIRWRDGAMEFADYWLAAYHYSLDGQGKPNCTFARERVFKREKGMLWRYFVHEGVIPVTVGAPIRPDYIQTWSIKHMRTDADLKKDRHRNLRLFEKRIGTLDARMKYYYGKELFENGMHLDAFKWLLDAISDPSLEPHDRILGIQYAAWTAMSCNQFERAIALSQQGIALAPNRAEFHTLIGDAYLKLNRPQDAPPFFAAAKACTNANPAGSAFAGPIFTHADAYSHYPRNQLTRIYANLGDFERAQREAEECFELHKSDETKAVLTEIQKYRKLYQINKEAKPTEDIVITCPPHGVYEWDAEIAKTKGMGGSETAAIEMAHALARLSGRRVKIFAPRAQAKTIGNVDYLPSEQSGEWLSQHKPWAHISWRHNMKVTDAPTYLWAHDLVTHGADNAANYEKMLCLTPFHKAFAMARQGVPEDKIFVTRNGIKPERFKDGPYLSRKKPFKFVFPSSPDRGLDRAMRVLDRVREKFPEVELHVFYGFENLRKFGLGARADEMEAMIKERPWVKFHGFTQQDVMLDHFKESAIWLHPCDFIETSCITAMEMLCAGVYPVTRALGGLKDTLGEAEKSGMATLLPHDCVTELEYQAYADATVKALEERAWERVSVDPEAHSWERVAQQWLRDLLPKSGGTEAVA